MQVIDTTCAPTMSVNLSVEAANTAPVAIDDGYSTPQDTVLNVAASGVLGNDTDADGDPLTAVLDTDVTGGTLTLNADGSFAYTPDTGSTGFDSFTYHANDGTADSNIVTVDLTIEAPNSPPVAWGDLYLTPQDTTLNEPASGVLQNDTDADDDPLTAVLDTDVANGTLTLNADGSFDYVPDAGYTGSDSFTYHANDGAADSNVATVDLTVTGPAGATISGTVTAAATPVEGAIVYVFDAGTAAYAGNAFTGATGAYSVSLPSGTYNLWVQTNTAGYPDQAYGGDGTFANATDIDLTTASQTADVVLAGAAAGACTISGTRDRRAAPAVEGAIVYVFDAGTAAYAGNAFTDATGAYSVSLAVGHLQPLGPDEHGGLPRPGLRR